MPNTASYVTAGKPNVGGAIYQAAMGTSLPTDTSTNLSDFTCLGYVSDDGLVNSNTPNGNTNVKAWGGDTVLTILGDKVDQFKFTLLEVLNVDVLKTVFGSANVTGDLSSEIAIKSNSSDLDEFSYAIDMIMRDNTVKRIVIPRAKVTSIGDIAYTDGDAVGYEITIDCYPDASGNTHYEYIKKNS